MGRVLKLTPGGGGLRAAARIAAVAGLIAAASNAFAANEECWGRGYRDGWCDGRGQPACSGRIPPRPSTPLPGQEDCDSRYIDGYVAGQKAGMPPKAD